MKTTDNIIKKYDLMAIYDPRCTNIVHATVEEKKVPAKIIADTYLYIKDLTSDQVDTYKNILSGCTLKSSDGTKTYKISFSSYKCDAILPKEKKDPKASIEERANKRTPFQNTDNATKEANKAAKRARAAKHAAKRIAKQQMLLAANKLTEHIGKHAANPNKDDKKKELLEGIPLAGRNQKKIMFRRGKSGFKNTYKVTPGTKENNLAKKMRQRANKAGQYLIKQETKQAVKQPVMQVKKGHKKPVQKEFALAA